MSVARSEPAPSSGDSGLLEANQLLPLETLGCEVVVKALLINTNSRYALPHARLQGAKNFSDLLVFEIVLQVGGIQYLVDELGAIRIQYLVDTGIISTTSVHLEAGAIDMRPLTHFVKFDGMFDHLLGAFDVRVLLAAKLIDCVV